MKTEAYVVPGTPGEGYPNLRRIGYPSPGAPGQNETFVLLASTEMGLLEAAAQGKQ